MCIIVDANVFSKVFDPLNEKHEEFKPVFEWIVKKNGKLVVGGSKYIKEITTIARFTKLLNQLKKARKIYYHSQAIVDAKALEFRDIFTTTDYDDQHILALIATTSCRLLCTNDEGLIKYAKMRIFYSARQRKVLIYKKKSDKTKLISQNIAEVCKPCITLPRISRDLINRSLPQ